MNKNLILGLAVAGALYWQFGRKKDEPEPSGIIEGSPIMINTPRWLNDEEAAKYLATYKDLSDAYGSDLEKAKWHFQNFGYLENRIF